MSKKSDRRSTKGRKNSKAMLAGIVTAAVVAALNWATPSIHAANFIWDSDATFGNGSTDGSGVWDLTTTNWNNGSADVAWVNNISNAAIIGALGSAGTLTLNPNVTVGNLTFAALVSANGYLINGTGSLFLASGTNSGTGVVTDNATGITNLAISMYMSGSNTINTAAGNLVISGRIYNTAAATVTKTGNGTLTLSGTADNSFINLTSTAGVTVLGVASGANIHAASSATVTGGTMTLSGTGGDQIFGGLTVNSAVFDMNGRNEAINLLNGNATGTLTNNGAPGSTLTVTAGTGTYSGVIMDGTSPMAMVYSGGGQILNNGTGATNYSGGTTLSGGSLSLFGGLVPNAGTMTMLGTGPLTINGGTLVLLPGSTLNNYYFNNNVSFLSGAIMALDGKEHFAGNIVVNNTSSVSLISRWGTKPLILDGMISGAGTITQVSSVSGSSDGAEVHITGTGNAFSGLYILDTFQTGQAGNVSLYLENDSAMAFATINVNTNSTANTNNGSHLRLTTANPVLGNLIGSGTVSLTQSPNTGTNTASTTPITLYVGNNNASSGTYSGVMTGPGSLVKIGTGTWTLSGANTFFGSASITSGRINLSNTSALQNALFINSATGGILSFDSSVASHAFTLGNLAGDGNLLLQDNASNSVLLSVGNGTVNSIATYTGVLSGTGGLTKVGATTLTLTAAQPYSGATVVNGGTLILNNSASIAASSSVSIVGGSGAILMIDATNATGGTLIRTGKILISNANGATNTAGFLFQAGSAGTSEVVGTLSAVSTGTISSVANVTLISYQGTTTLTASDLDRGAQGHGVFNISTQLNGSSSLGLGVGSYVGAPVVQFLVTNATTLGLIGGSGIASSSRSKIVPFAIIPATGFLTYDANGLQLAGYTSSVVDGNTTLDNVNGYLGNSLSLPTTYNSLFGYGQLTLNNTTLTVNSGAVAAFNSDLNFSGGTLKLSHPTENLFYVQGVNASISSAIQASNVTFVKTWGSGGTVWLSAPNPSLTGHVVVEGETSGGALVLNLANLNALQVATLDTNGNGTIAFGAATASTYTFGGLTGSNNLTIPNASLSLSIGGNNETTTFSGALTSSANFRVTKEGTGTLTLAGAADNAFMNLTVNSGVVVLAKTSTGTVHAAGGSGSILILNAGTVTLGGSGGDQIFNGGTTTMNGGVLDMAGLNETIYSLGSSVPTALIVNNGTSATSILNASGGTSTFAGMLQNGLGTLGLSYSTAGNTLTLTGTANTYTGTTTFTAGTLRVAATGALGSGPATFGGGTLMTDTDSILVGPVTLSSTATINGTANVTVNGTLSGAGGITYSGAGTLTLTSSANTYTGTTTVNSGKFLLANNVVATASALTITSGGTVSVDDTNRTAGSLIRMGALTLNNAGLGLVVTGGTASTTDGFGALAVNGGISRLSVNVLEPTSVLTTTTLSTGALTRSNSGTLNFITNGTLGANAIFLIANATSNLVSGIIPYAAAYVNGQPAGFVTYNATGGILVAGNNALIVNGATDLTENFIGDANSPFDIGSANNAATTIASFYNTNNGATLSLGSTLTINSGALMTGTNLTINDVSGTGTGVLFLGNATANTEGVFLNQGGTVTINNIIANYTGATTGVTFSLNAGTAASYVLAGANTFRGNATPQAGVALTIANALALQNATLNIGLGTASFSSANATNAFTLGGLAGSGTLALANETDAGVNLTIGNSSANTSYAGILTGAGTLTKIGSGSIILSNAVSTANSYAGGTVINGGMINLWNGAFVPAAGTVTPLGTGPITLNAGGTLWLQPGSTGNAYNFSNSTFMSGGTLFMVDGLPTFSGTMTVGAGTNSTIGARWRDKWLTLSGPLVGPSTGTLTLQTNPGGNIGVVIVKFTNASTNNSFNGTLFVNNTVGGVGGISAFIDAANALANATVTLNGNPASGGSAIILEGISTATLGGLAGSGNIALQQTASANAVTLNIGNNGFNSTYTGQITNGTSGNPGIINKIGTGTLTFGAVAGNSTQTYTGATNINAGTVVYLSNNAATGSAAIVASGANLLLDNTTGGAPAASRTRFASVTVASSNDLVTGLTVKGNSTANTSDIITGALGLGSGIANVTLTAAGTANMTLTAGSLVRNLSVGGLFATNGTFGTNTLVKFTTAPNLLGGNTASAAATNASIVSGVVLKTPLAQGFAFYSTTSGLMLAGTGPVVDGDAGLNNFNGDASLLSNFTSAATTLNSIYNNPAGANILTLGNPMTVNSGNIATLQDLTLSGSTLTLGNATANVEGVILSFGKAVTINSVISNYTGSTSGVSYVGWNSASFTLNAANNYSGNTNVSGTVLNLGNTSALQYSTLNVANNGSYNINGSLTALTLGGLGGNQRFSTNNTSGGAVTLTVGGNNQTTVFSGGLTGAGALVKVGTGNLFFTGNVTTSYAGTTTILGGQLWLGQFGSGNQFTAGLSAAPILVSGSTSALAMGGTTGTTVINYTMSQFITLDNGGELFGSDGAQWLTGSLMIGSGGGTVQVDWNNKPMFLQGSIGGAGTLTVIGGGGNNTPNGGALNINSTFSNFTGTLLVGSAGSTTPLVGIAATLAGAVVLGSGNAFVNAAVIVNSNGNGGLGAGMGFATGVTAQTIGSLSGAGLIQLQSANNSLPTTLTMNALGNATTTFSGGFTGAGAIAKDGTGTLTLNNTSNANTFAGSANLMSGAVQVSAANVLSSATASGAIAFSGGTLQYGNAAGASTDYSFRIRNSTSAILINTNGLVVTYANGIDSSNSGGATKLGAGTLVMNGYNGYSGTTNINQGTLVDNGGINGPVNVNAGASFAGSGSVFGMLTVNGGATLNLQDGTPATLNLYGGLTLLGGSTLNFDLGSSSDALGVNFAAFSQSGPITVNYANIPGFNIVTTSQTFTLISNAAGINAANFVNGITTKGYAYTLNSSSQPGNLLVRVDLVAPFVAFWKGDVDGNWSTNLSHNTNWATNAGGATDAAEVPAFISDIHFAAVSPATLTTTMDDNFTINTLTFDPGTADVSIAGGSTLTIGSIAGGGSLTLQNGAGNVILSAAQVILGTANTWTNNDPVKVLTVSSTVAGAASLTTSGVGRIVLSGSSSFSGGLMVGNSSLAAGAVNALGTGDVTINGSSQIDLAGYDQTIGGLASTSASALITNGSASAITLTLNPATSNVTTYAGQIQNGAGTISLTKNGSGTQILTGASAATGAVTIAAGKLQLGDGVSFNGSLAGPIVIGNSTASAATLSVANVSAQSIGNLSGTGGLAVNAATFATLTLTGTSTYAGSTLVNSGGLIVGNAGALPLNTALSIGATGLADLNGLNATVGSLSGAAGGTLANNAAGTLPILVVNQNITTTFAGLIADGAGKVTLLRNGTAGTFTLSGANTFTGGATLNSPGAMTRLLSTSGLGTGTVTLIDGILRLAAGANATYSNTIYVSNLSPTGGRIESAANISLGGNVLGNGTVTVANTASSSVWVSGDWSNFQGTALFDNTNANLFVGVQTSAANLINMSQMQLTTVGLNTIAHRFAISDGGAGTVTLGALNGTAGAIAAGTNGSGFSEYQVGFLNTSTTFGGALLNSGTGTLSLTKVGTGTLTLSGTANVYSGPTTIAAGALQVGNGSTGSFGTGSVINNSSLIFNMSSALAIAGPISGNGNIFQNGAGTTTFNSTANSYVGTTTVNAGILAAVPTTYQPVEGAVGTPLGAAGNTLVVNAGGTVTVFGNGGTGNVPNWYMPYNLQMNGGSFIFNDGSRMHLGASSSTAAYTITINGSGNVFASQFGDKWLLVDGILTGTGTLTLRNVTGALGVNSVRFANASTNNTFSGTIIVDTVTNSGEGLYIDGGTVLANATIDSGVGATQKVLPLNFDAPLANATISQLIGSGNFNLVNNATAGGTAFTLAIGNNNASSTFGGVMSGVGGMAKIGSGTFTLTGNNNFTGTATVAAGTLQIGNAGTTGTAGAGAIINNGTLLLNRSNALTIAGAISGTGNLVQGGAGTTTLSSTANSYSGSTTVNAGTLLVKGALGTSGITVNTGAALGFTGPATVAGLVTVNAGGTLNSQDSLGNAVTLAGGLALNGGAALGFDLGAASDVVNITGGGYSFAAGTAGTATILAVGFAAGFDLGSFNVITGATGINAAQFTAPADVLGFHFALDSTTSAGSLAIVVGSSAYSTLYWRGNATDSNWSNINWSTVPSLADNATSGPLGPTNVIFNNTNSALASLDVNGVVRSLEFSGAGGATIGGTKNLQLIATSGITMDSGSGPVTLNTSGSLTFGGPASWTNNDPLNLLSIASAIVGSTLTLAGAGSVLLSGSNSGLAGLVVNNGKLVVGSANAAGTDSLTLNTLLDLNGVALSAGALSGAGTITTGTAATASMGTSVTGVSSFTGTILNGAGTVSLVKSGAGTLILAANDSYTGTTTVNAGKLIVASASALPTNSALALGASGTIDLNGYNTSVTGLSGVAGGNIRNDSAGTLVVLDINQAGTSSYAGTLVNGTGTLALTKSGLGTLTLAGANTFTGSTTVNGGAIILGNGAALGAASNTLTFAAGSNATVSLNGNSITLAGLSGDTTASVQNASATGATLTINNSVSASIFNGVLADGTGGGALGLTLTGKLTLGSVSTYTGATTIHGGTLTMASGSHITSGTGAQITIGDTSGTNAVLVVNDATALAAKTTSPSIALATTGGSAGYIQMTGGTITTASELHMGNGGGGTAGDYAAFSMSGGNVTTGSWLVVGFNNDRAVFNVSGGTVTSNGNPITIGAGGGAAPNAIGVMNVSGGTVIANNAAPGIYVGESGIGVLNVSGAGKVSLVGSLTMARLTAGYGVVNLLGGSLTARAITMASAGTGIVNFHGGTLIAGASAGAFMTGLTAAYVWPGGGTIDDGGNSITITQPLLAPVGNGVTSISVTGGTGYIDTPVVQITGDGVGATAVANVAADGTLAGITVTNPGTGYTSGTVTLYGGGGSGASTPLATFGTSSSGTIVKTGAGRIDLGTFSSFTGGVTLLGGTLSASNTIAGSTTASIGPGVLTLTSGTFRGQISGNVNYVLANNIVANGNANFNTSGGASATLTGNLSGSGTLNRTGGSGPMIFAGADNSGFRGLLVNESGNNVGDMVFIAPSAYPASDFKLTQNSTNSAIFQTTTATTVSIGALSGNSATAKVTIDSGTNVVATTLSVGSANANSTYQGILNSNSNNTMTLTKTGSGSFTLGSANTYTSTGALNVNAGTLAFSATGAARHTSAVLVQANAASVASGATLDLSNHDMLIHGGSTATLESKIGAAYFFGLWNKPGITSSTAQTNPITSLGIMSGADYNVFSPTPGTFDGVPVANTDTVIKFTYVGDLNLDGLVNDDDLFIFNGAYFFGGTGNYALGDLNFDGLVNDDDLFLFNGNYFFPPSTPLGGLGDTSLASAAAPAGGAAPVPEPASLVLLGMGATALLSRRKNRRRIG